MPPDGLHPHAASGNGTEGGARDFLARICRLLVNPTNEWLAIRDISSRRLKLLLVHAGLLSIFASIAWATGQVTLTPSNNPGLLFLVLTVKTFALYAVSIGLQGLSIAVLMPMYGVKRAPGRAMVLAGFGYTPLLVCGLLTVYPLLSIAMVIAVPLVGYQLHVGARIVAGVRPGDAAEFAAASMVLATLASIATGGVLAALGVF